MCLMCLQLLTLICLASLHVAYESVLIARYSNIWEFVPRQEWDHWRVHWCTCRIAQANLPQGGFLNNWICLIPVSLSDAFAHLSLTNKDGEKNVSWALCDWLFTLLSSSVPVMMPGFWTRSNLWGTALKLRSSWSPMFFKHCAMCCCCLRSRVCEFRLFI